LAFKHIVLDRTVDSKVGLLIRGLADGERDRVRDAVWQPPKLVNATKHLFSPSRRRRVCDALIEIAGNEGEVR